jgi:hypothetical protein
MSTLEALSQMARDHKSSLGVTDPANGQLISNLSVSDLRCGLETVVGFKGDWGRRYWGLTKFAECKLVLMAS